MTSKKIILYILTLIFAVALTGCKLNSNQINNQSQNTQSIQSENRQTNVDFQASFAVFTNGTFRVFTNNMYHNRSADVFITSKNPNIVNVKKTQITWGDFFNSLPMQLTNGCLTTGTGQKFCNSDTQSLKFYINGEKVENFVEVEIEAKDKALIFYGAKTETPTQKQFNQIPTP